MENKKFVFLSISDGGWTGYNKTVRNSTGSSKSHTSGYGEPDYSRVEDGALVLDNLPCRNRGDFVHAVLSSPLVDVDLVGEEVEGPNVFLLPPNLIEVPADDEAARAIIKREEATLKLIRPGIGA